MAKLSIITVNLNNRGGLLKTMQSVFGQTFSDYEYIIIDGESSDGSRELIEENRNRLHYWVSEKDGGIFHAMNKGIRQAKGEYLYFLNAGDCLNSKETLETVLPECDADITFGDLLLDKGDRYEELIWPDRLPFSFFISGTNSIPHQAAFIKKRVFEKTGLYLEDKKIVADWAHFLLAINRDGFSYKHVNRLICTYNMEGISAQEAAMPLIKAERRAVLESFFPTFVQDYDRLFLLEKSWNRLHRQKLVKLCISMKRKLHHLKLFPARK